MCLLRGNNVQRLAHPPRFAELRRLEITPRGLSMGLTRRGDPRGEEGADARGDMLRLREVEEDRDSKEMPDFSSSFLIRARACGKGQEARGGMTCERSS